MGAFVAIFTHKTREVRRRGFLFAPCSLDILDWIGLDWAGRMDACGSRVSLTQDAALKLTLFFPQVAVTQSVAFFPLIPRAYRTCLSHQ